MHKAFLVLALVAGGIFMTSSTALAAPPGTITGQVLTMDNIPLSGATVNGGNKTAVTDSSGKYTLWHVAAGTQTVIASKTGYLSGSVKVTVSSKSSVTAPAIKLAPLAPSYGAMAGRVTSATSSAPIAGASAVVSGTQLQTFTDGNGNYAFSKVLTGATTVAVSADGFQTLSQTAGVSANATTTLNFSLTPTPAPAVNPPGGTIIWNGAARYLLGTNYPWWNYATEFGTGGWGKYTDWNAIDADFAAMNTSGVKIVRWWVFGDGRYSPEWNADGTVAGLDSAFLGNVDQALAIAAKYHVYLIFSLVDNIIWGPATWSGTVQMGGRSALITDPVVQQSFFDNAVRPFLEHVAANPNRNMVVAYDIVSEPEAQMAGFWGGVGLDPAAVQAFVRRAASYIHTYGAGAYATLDSAMPSYVPTWKNLGLDFYQFHYYPWMDFGGAPGSGLPTYASLALDKPAVVSEYPTLDNSYGLTDTAPLSAKWYLDTIHAYGYAGALGWSYRAGDQVSNWPAFQPVFSAWASAHATTTGP